MTFLHKNNAISSVTTQLISFFYNALTFIHFQNCLIYTWIYEYAMVYLIILVVA